jgi:hypothetical protein
MVPVVFDEPSFPSLADGETKGSASIRLRNGEIRTAEIHWYEAHGIGKREFKRKRYLD